MFTESTDKMVSDMWNCLIKWSERNHYLNRLSFDDPLDIYDALYQSNMTMGKSPTKMVCHTRCPYINTQYIITYNTYILHIYINTFMYIYIISSIYIYIYIISSIYYI